MASIFNFGNNHFYLFVLVCSSLLKRNVGRTDGYRQTDRQTGRQASQKQYTPSTFERASEKEHQCKISKLTELPNCLELITHFTEDG